MQNTGGRLPDIRSLRSLHPLPEVASRYIDLRQDGAEFSALCPFHADRNPSLSIYRKPDSDWRFHCFACGAHGDVFDFVRDIESLADTGAAIKRLQGDPTPPVRIEYAPPPKTHAWQPFIPVPAHAGEPFSGSRWKFWNPKRGREWSPRPDGAWAYTDADGALLGYVIRVDFADGKKITPAVTYCVNTETGEEQWCMRPFRRPAPLYGMQDLAARPDAPVLVVSGEKCADAGAALLRSQAVITWPGGDENSAHADWSVLAGRRVTLWMDADKSGRKAGDVIGRILSPIVAQLREIDTTGQTEGWDIADAIAEGMDRAAVLDFCRQRVRPWVPLPEHEAQKSPGTEGGDTGALPADGESAHGAEPSYDATGADIVALPKLDAIPAAAEFLQREKIVADIAGTLDPRSDDIPDLYSEDNAALAFSAVFADDLRFVAPWGRWMIWDGQRWVHEDTLAVFDMARKVARSIAMQCKDDPELTAAQRKQVSARYGQASTIASIERLARADRRHAATIDQWDADIWMLNTPAGAVDLRTGNIRPGDRESHMTKITSVAPGGECPSWLEFLNTATDGDQDLIGFLQRMAGYSLTGSTRDHALFFVYGTGGNGKGTFLNTLQWILGDYARSAPADMFTERKHEAHTTELARLMGARLVAAQETEEGKRWAEAKIKSLTGGDPITARFMRQDDFEFIPQFKLVMTGNHKPGLRNVDEAIKRRLYLIPFTVTIPAEKRDPNLPEKLRAEAGGILAWCIEGCKQWQRVGLQAPDSVKAATSEYLEQQDVLGLWMDEAIDQLPGFNVRRGDLYKSFKAWAEGAGEYVLPQKRFVAAMESRGFRSLLSRGIHYIEGVRLRQGGDFDPPPWER